MMGTQSTLVSLENVAIVRLGEAEFAQRFQQQTHVVARPERVKVIGPQSPPKSLESAAKERLGEVKLALVLAAVHPSW